MKNILILIAALVLSYPAMAETVPQEDTTKITTEISQAYFDSCMAARDNRMSRKAQDHLCTCTAAKMKELMSVDDLKTMGQENQEGRNMLNRMLLDIYIPCMDVPLTEMVADECMMEDRMSVENMHRADLCRCTAEKTSAWFVDSGRDLMRKVLEENPNMTDPLEPVMSSAAFRETSLENMTSCLNNKGR